MLDRFDSMIDTPVIPRHTSCVSYGLGQWSAFLHENRNKTSVHVRQPDLVLHLAGIMDSTRSFWANVRCER